MKEPLIAEAKQLASLLDGKETDWYAVEKVNGWHIYGEHGTLVAFVLGPSTRYDGSVARLIAAAPKMARLLRIIVGELERDG